MPHNNCFLFYFSNEKIINKQKEIIFLQLCKRDPPLFKKETFINRSVGNEYLFELSVASHMLVKVPLQDGWLANPIFTGCFRIIVFSPIHCNPSYLLQFLNSVQ